MDSRQQEGRGVNDAPRPLICPHEDRKKNLCCSAFARSGCSVLQSRFFYERSCRAHVISRWLDTLRCLRDFRQLSLQRSFMPRYKKGTNHAKRGKHRMRLRYLRSSGRVTVNGIIYCHYFGILSKEIG